MKFQAYNIILRRQVKHKLGRFLIASGGIAVGIWLITLLVGMSSGVQNALLIALNSQPSAKEFQLSKIEEKNFNFFSNTSPTFIPLSKDDLALIKKNYSQIDTLRFEDALSLNISQSDSNTLIDCQNTLANGPIPTGESDIPEGKYCKNIEVDLKDLNTFFAENRSAWIGQEPKDFTDQDIALCYSCSRDIYKLFNVEKPEQMIGKKVTVQLLNAPFYYKLGQKIRFSEAERGSFDKSVTVIKTFETRTFTIKAVVDDAKQSTISFTPYAKAYFPESLFADAFAIANPGENLSDYGKINIRGTVKEIDQLNSFLEQVAKEYFVFSGYQSLVTGVNYLFLGLQIVFAFFGIIAILASVFGIVNVMTISVLERKKEIGILKSLGARDSGIFSLFLSESAILGCIGWVIGTLLALLTGAVVSGLANVWISSMPEVQKSLNDFGITTIGPTYPWWLYITTLAIALFFTLLSGLLPSLRAARQNPAEVMRTE